MANENIEVYQISPKSLCVAFHKNALASLKEGGSLALKVKVGRRDMTMLFMRDVAFKERLAEFRQSKDFRDMQKSSLWQRAKSLLSKPFAPKPVVTGRGTVNRPLVKTNGG